MMLFERAIGRLEHAVRTIQDDGHILLVVLTQISHVDRIGDVGLAGEPFVSELGKRGVEDELELLLDQRFIDMRRAKGLRPDLVDPALGYQHSERGRVARGKSG